jgi:5-methylcytosine-specific restriction endonuclease McrA
LEPARELDPANLMALCRSCHLFVGHLGSWESYNPAALEDAAAWLAKIKARP